eukprot:scaffold119890_cov15-Tisochrysis_lutea.AAC.1
MTHPCIQVFTSSRAKAPVVICHAHKGKVSAYEVGSYADGPSAADEPQHTQWTAAAGKSRNTQRCGSLGLDQMFQ